MARVIPIHEIAVDDPRAQRAQAAYAEDLRVIFGFVSQGPDAPEPGTKRLIALDGDEPVALGGIRPLGRQRPDACEIKRMWVHADWRGHGLGTRMLRELEDLGRRSGYARVYLDSNPALLEAIALYDRSGYRRIARYNDNPDAGLFFTKDL